MMLNFANYYKSHRVFVYWSVAIKHFKKSNNDKSLHLLSTYNTPGNVLKDLDGSIHLVLVTILQDY